MNKHNTSPMVHRLVIPYHRKELICLIHRTESVRDLFILNENGEDYLCVFSVEALGNVMKELQKKTKGLLFVDVERQDFGEGVETCIELSYFPKGPKQFWDSLNSLYNTKKEGDNEMSSQRYHLRVQGHRHELIRLCHAAGLEFFEFGEDRDDDYIIASTINQVFKILKVLGIFDDRWSGFMLTEFDYGFGDEDCFMLFYDEDAWEEWN